MKLLLAAMIGIFGFMATASADEHSENVCSSQDQTVCAHVGFHWGVPTTKAEGKFVFHATPASGEISDLKIDLWMDMGNGHGHGSAPVALKKMGKNQYAVSNAYFVMPGAWLIRADFKIGNDSFQLDIPLTIAE